MAIELNRQTGAPVSPPRGVSGAEFEAAFGRIRDPEGHLMEILTAIGGEPS